MRSHSAADLILCAYIPWRIHNITAKTSPPGRCMFYHFFLNLKKCCATVQIRISRGVNVFLRQNYSDFILLFFLRQVRYRGIPGAPRVSATKTIFVARLLLFVVYKLMITIYTALTWSGKTKSRAISQYFGLNVPLSIRVDRHGLYLAKADWI